MKLLRERPWAVGALAIGLLAFLVFGRALRTSRSELAVANAHKHGGNVARAIEHYRRSMRWSFPLNPYPGKAATELVAIAKQLEEEGDIDQALAAWRAVSGSSAATRFLYSGRSALRERADDEIARLVATHESAPIDAGLSDARLTADHRALLSKQGSPDPLWASLLLAGFAGWIAGLVIAVRRGFDAAGRLRWGEARAALSGALIGFVAFVLGMLFA